MIKINSKIICLISLILSSCYYGIFDWNQNHLNERYKKEINCVSTQLSIAENILGRKLTTEQNSDINNKCYDNHKYEARRDSTYSKH